MCNRSFQNSGGGYSYSYSYSSSSSNSNSNWTTRSFNSSQCPKSVMNGGPAAIQDFESSGSFEEDVLKAHNEYRALHGVPPLELSKDLCRYAMEWAKGSSEQPASQSPKNFEREVLKAHNDYRALHGVPPLELDKNLCKHALEWAKNLSARGVMQHRANNSYGENLYAKYGTGNITVTGLEPVKSWYDEVSMYNFNSHGFSSGTGHFTQVVWRGSKKLGVAKVENNKGQVFVVANYDPPGNYQGQFEQNVPRAGTVATPLSAGGRQEQSQAVTVKKDGAGKSLAGFSEFEVESLHSHNKYRAMHKAPPLTLNKNLCKFAEEWAKNLASRGVMQHRSNNKYGENIYYKWGTGNIQVSGSDAVDSWYSEIKDYRFNSPGFASGTGHFTQVVWKGSTELGVGMAKNSKNQIYVVANYNPPGNFQGDFKQNVLPK